MQVGDVDGHGRYGVLDEDADGLLCHECGGRFTHLGLHAYRAYGVPAAAFRQSHELSSRGLVVEATRQTITDNARARFYESSNFARSRDIARAKAAYVEAGSVISPAGLEALRQASVAGRGRQRLGTVVVCQWCAAAFCPLTAVKKRRLCSRSCAAKHARSLTKSRR